MNYPLSLGATLIEDRRCRFRVWAPLMERVEVHLVAPEDQYISMIPDENGYFEVIAENVAPGTLYYFRLNGEKERPDPASRSQPQGVHGPSEVIDQTFPWEDGDWPGIRLSDYIFYELNVGTFTPEGTFEAVIPYLDELKELGITGIEIMPIAQFPGTRNWGYDGVGLFAVQNSYGGLNGLKKLVNACHQKELAVVLDVVYNHLGAEGNYLWDYGPYFTDRYKTPWGSSVNFDGPYNDEVRRFFLENALYWLSELHIDAFRLDAVDAILDFSVPTFLEELTYTVDLWSEETNRKAYLIAECDLHNPRILAPRELNGYGLDAQWNDDFHHCVHTILTGEQSGYYSDFGKVGDLAKAIRDGFVYSGQYSKYRKKRLGMTSRDVPAWRFSVCVQNHDQVGNRMMGERLNHLVSFESLKLAAGALLLSPYLPLIFMGEEYAEPAPFLYFVNHGDPDLVEAVRQGRKQEFSSFQWHTEPPDPQDEATFQKSKLNRHLRHEGHHKILWQFYKTLIDCRKRIPALNHLDKDHLEAISYEHLRVLYVLRWFGKSHTVSIFNFNENPISVEFPIPPGLWRKEIDSLDECWLVPGTKAKSKTPAQFNSPGDVNFTLSANSFVLFSKEL
jgi:maltooligosyltrehalose trehalohydrolase